MKFKNESGRSMVEMLGVLAIIGVLSIGGIAGYVLSMNRYRANQALDLANKYASVIYSSYQSTVAMGTSWTVPTFAQSKVGNEPDGTTFTYDTASSAHINDGKVFISIKFPSVDICKTAYKILGEAVTGGNCGSDATGSFTFDND